MNSTNSELELVLLGFSIIVAILGTLLGYRYGKKQFAASYYPTLDVQLESKRVIPIWLNSHATYFSLEIQNYSKLNIGKLQLKTYIKRSWFFRRKQVEFPIFMEKRSIKTGLSAGESWPIRFNPQQGDKQESLEDFLARNFPNYIVLQERGNQAKASYQVPKQKPIVFIVCLQYAPEIRSKQAKQVWKFLLEPYMDETGILNWRVGKKDSHFHRMRKI